MNFHKFTCTKKNILIVSILAISLASLVVIPTVYALHPAGNDSVTKIITAAENEISYRDIFNNNKQVDPHSFSEVLSEDPIATVEVDSTTAGSGFLSIEITDVDANLDASALDVILSSANSTTSGLVKTDFELTETDVDSGMFTGQLLISSEPEAGKLQVVGGDDVIIQYVPEPWGVGRFFANFSGITDSPEVTLTDVIVDGPLNCNKWDIVTHPVQLSITPGTGTIDDATVIINFANRWSVTDFGVLEILYRADENGKFEPLGGQIVFANLPNNQIQNTSPPPNVEGQYALGFDSGCTGGGGGGLVRPGLVVNALAGISLGTGGGGGAGPPGPTLTLGALALYDSAVEIISLPQEIRDIALNYDPHTPLEPIIDIYEDFDLPFSINGIGFTLGGYENTIETQTIEPGEPTEFVIVYYTNSEIAHTSLYFNLGPTRMIAGSDTQVLLYKDKPVEIIDSNGNIATATGSINNEDDLKRLVTFSITFSEDIQWSNSDLVIRSWTDQLSSGDTIIYDAIDVASPQIVEIADEDLPEPEIQTLKSRHVPIWIKNNAAWWSQELIEDSDFVAGIEYLIQQEIITLTESGTLETSSSDEIPAWIKNNAGWWSEDLITEKEFIDGLQWLISNGIIQVTET